MSLRGGNHKPYQLPCPGTVLCGVGPRYQHKKLGEGAVPAVHETTKVNGIDPASLLATTICGVDSEHPVAYDGTNNGASPTPHGPWVLAAAPVPPTNTFAGGYMVVKADISDGGTGYAADQVLTVVGGTANNAPATIKVVSVDGAGKITAAGLLTGGGYTANPASPNSPTGGSGTGASFNLTFGTAMVDLSTCRKRGFKNVQARRFWHGTRPWTTGLGVLDKNISCMGMYASYQPNVDDTKYLTVTYDVHIDRASSHVGGTQGSSSQSVASGSVSVDKWSGRLSSTLTSNQDAQDSVFGDSPHVEHGVDGGVCEVDSYLVELHLSAFPLLVVPSPGMGPPTNMLDYIGNWNTQAIALGATPLPDVTDFNSYNGSGTKPIDEFSEIMESLSVSFLRTATVVSWDILYSVAAGEAYPTYNHWHGSMSLSNPNPGSDVYADALSLIAQWNMNDDIQYPWRMDGSVGVAPLVTRNEVPGHVSPTSSNYFHRNIDGTTWVDPAAASYDGAILGAPLPAGYGYRADGSAQGIFDFRHETKVFCYVDPADGIGPSYWDSGSYGARTPWYLPQNCPQWTQEDMVQFFPAGKWLMFGGLTQPITGAWLTSEQPLWVQDWLQCEETWPSYDFARPAGADRFVYDESLALVDRVFPYLSGYSSGTGDTIVLGSAPVEIVDVKGNAPGSVADDHGQLPLGHPVDYIPTYGGGGSLTLPTIGATEVWGGQCVGGFYNVTRVSDNSVLLGTKIYGVPTGWTCPSGDMATAFGRLRFPDCPGILGRVPIGAITNAAPCQLTIDSSPYLAMKLTASPALSEQVDLCDAAMNVLASNVALTRVSDTTFTVPNSGATAYATIAAAKFVVSHLLHDGVTPGTHYWWDDEMPKHHVLTLEFAFDYRLWNEGNRYNQLITNCLAITPTCDCSGLGSRPTIPPSEYSGFTAQQICLPFTQCGPKVVRTLNFPATFPLDAQYGSRWAAVVASAIQHPLWQAPHHPPTVIDPLSGIETSKYRWLQDSGGLCLADTADPATAYYPMFPLVEPFIYLPTSGITADSTTTTADSSSDASGGEEAPALPPGIVVGFTSPVDHNDGNTIFAPYPGSQLLPWVLHQNLCGCIAGAGRFAADYAKFTLLCN